MSLPDYHFGSCDSDRSDRLHRPLGAKLLHGNRAVTLQHRSFDRTLLVPYLLADGFIKIALRDKTATHFFDVPSRGTNQFAFVARDQGLEPIPLKAGQGDEAVQ